MARGLWRCWTERNGVDTWWAGVEVRLGDWADIEQMAYELAGYQPTFWELPLQADYVASLPEPAMLQAYKAELRIVPLIVIGAIALGGLLIALLITGLRLFGR